MKKLCSNSTILHQAAQPFTFRCAAPGRKHPNHLRQAVKTQAWTQVIDQASGKPYYWNTATNETAWDLPQPSQAAPAVAQTTSSHTTAAVQDTGSSSSPQESTPQELSPEELFNALAAAYAADGSGMEFWEVARAHRSQGVFDPPFFDYLEQRQKAEDDPAGKDLAFKMMCRLSNPLLRQPAPFE